ncbi:MAG: DUF4011 domain-containing protein [Bacteroidetes bacterium]|nr:DUF4011 domain-containing protein [Bacteroidota bacterium]
MHHTFDITQTITHQTTIGDEVEFENKNNDIQLDFNAPIKHPVYLLNYKCYEIELQHHDASSDIFVLGMLMAGIALGLDFTDESDLISFVENRESIIYLNSAIHPAIANIITGSTHIDRRNRWNDLTVIIDNLCNYREYNSEANNDLSLVEKQKNNNHQNRNRYINSKLRNRLFDTSRRNRMLYFKPNLKYLNLTVSSVPQVLNYKNINPDLLFYWNNEISKKIISGKDISLSKYVRFEDNAYIAPTLDRIRLESNKDVNEYGFSQLKLVLNFLHWYNLKEDVTEKISSPFMMQSVKLVKQKGLKDQYILELIDTEVEINPVLSTMLKELYHIKLPEYIQLNEQSMDEIYNDLKTQIEKTNSGIVLEKYDKPKIKLIHAQAKQTLTQYTRKINRKRQPHSFHNIDYSYAADNFQPLGLQLFKNYIKPEHSSLEFLINSDIKAAPQNFAPHNNESRTMYELEEGTANPFKWEFDLCNMVLGNFNYKKMSLVSDYNSIIESEIENKVFNDLFSALPRKLNTGNENENEIDNQYNVVQADPTQNNALAFARKGESYIIQGPPGTGKSQTISNLIADYVARGKKVLFVCEKRAAIDVVFHRLKQQQLDSLCCLIHDSQTDKKEFVMNLKSTFEQFTKSSLAFNNIQLERTVIITKIKQELNIVADYHRTMQSKLHNTAISLHQLFEILIETKKYADDNINTLSKTVEGYSQWIAYGESIEKLSSLSQNVAGVNYYAQLPFKYVSENAISNKKPHTSIAEELKNAFVILKHVSSEVSTLDLPQECIASIDELQLFIEQCIELVPFINSNNTDLLTMNSALHKKLKAAINKVEKAKQSLREAEKKNNFWINKFSETDAENALAIMQKHEGSFFAFLNGQYRKTKKAINASYNFSQHKIKPTYTQVVENLKTEFALQKTLLDENITATQLFNMGDLGELAMQLERWHNEASGMAIKYLQQNKPNKDAIEKIQKLKPQFDSLVILLHNNLNLGDNKSIAQIENIIDTLPPQLHKLSAYAPYLKELIPAHRSLKKILYEQHLHPVQIKTLLAKASVDSILNANNEVHQTEGSNIEYHIEKIKNLYTQLLQANAKYIVAKQQDQLNRLLKKSELSMAGKSDTEKEEKRMLIEGRKILDNEFTKSMRYKSIRELSSSASGNIIRELKPVWLMSPLSVSDTLPLQQNLFDVVIFDEASQITLEEGVPPLYRAMQTIIVGDEMQMPPTNFFSSTTADPDDLWTDDDDAKLLALDADSFLTQGARKFSTVMLGWHYRSRHEALISFSNASFYENKLLTIPDHTDHHYTQTEIVAHSSNDAGNNMHALLQRPISYHYISNGVYENRSNTAEAEYIAQLIRALLNEKNNMSIGVVAFSMEQQGEIENAVQELFAIDKEFERAIEEEYKRVDDNQFAGIFFKNLENVQGDERDIIIMSTCYGYDAKGKMTMNFGPINRRGGEKRLNVIFSRAKKRMCVVSSMKFTDIKNEYNEGANYFRKYLQYTELASNGDMAMANLVLKSVTDEKNIAANIHEPSAMVYEIEQWLQANGFVTKINIGQSHFKCHIGIKKNLTDKSFFAGILIDDSVHYQNNDVLEQYLFKPEILKNSGWKIIQVLTKDWYENKEKTGENLLNQLHQLEKKID